LKNLALARLLAGEGLEEGPADPVPTDVLACNFWLLAATENSPYASQAWFAPGGQPLPVVDAFRRWVALCRETQSSTSQEIDGEVDTQDQSPVAPPVTEPVSRLIQHYVLLPLYAWGAADWDLNAIQPLLEQSHPTIGFSLAEACLAERVTVVGGEGAFTQESLDMLRSAGCSVERIQDVAVATV
jgi:hypothetical protein